MKRIVGLMSGTSVDSIDAACVEISGAPPNYEIHIRAFATLPWTIALRSAILDVCRPDAPLQLVTVLDTALGEHFAAAAIEAIREAGWELASVDAIASHGQTIWHQPTAISAGGCLVAGTNQIGDPAVIARLTGCTVVSGFRRADMAAGGQGAPLTPYADYALFRSNKQYIAVQNLGGIGNVTYLPANCTLSDVIAFDTGPANLLLDGLAGLISGAKFDMEGALAASGAIHEALLNDWLGMEFFATPPPRTTGREMFGAAAAAELLRNGAQREISQADLMCTAVEITVQSIARSYRDYLGQVDVVVLAGGGVRNAHLVRRLREELEPARVAFSDDFGVGAAEREAAAFALLAYETLHRRPSNVPSATGAKHLAVLGSITYP